MKTKSVCSSPVQFFIWFQFFILKLFSHQNHIAEGKHIKMCEMREKERELQQPQILFKFFCCKSLQI